MDKVSVLINTCDKYEDVWYPFFRFFRRNWNCPYKVYLNTETKQCKENDVINLNSGFCDSWSLRLKNALKKIKSKYVIFLLEDFFLLEPVEQNEIDNTIKIMESDKKISVITFEICQRFLSKPTKYFGYNQRDLSSMYFLNCQASIWRRKDLIEFLNPYENPWQFELFGSNRAKLYSKLFLVSNGSSSLPFKYKINVDSGYGIYRGKWLKSNVKLFLENGLDVDFNKLGFYDGTNVDVKCPAPKKCFKDRWMFLLYGGGIKTRMGFFEQFNFAIKHPIEHFRILKRKLIYFFTDRRNV